MSLISPWNSEVSTYDQISSNFDILFCTSFLCQSHGSSSPCFRTQLHRRFEPWLLIIGLNAQQIQPALLCKGPPQSIGDAWCSFRQDDANWYIDVNENRHRTSIKMIDHTHVPLGNYPHTTDFPYVGLLEARWFVQISVVRNHIQHTPKMAMECSGSKG